MLRYLGVPARVAVGFSSGTYDGSRGVWRVSDHDAHAWVEVWFRGYGWLPFDPTPSGRPERGRLSAPYAAAILAGAGVRARRRGIRGLDLGDPRGAAHHHGEEGAGVRGARAGGRPPAAAPTAAACSLLLALVAAAIAAGIVVTKLAVRRARYLTRDPRRLAAACRQELADYLLDQRIDAARSATLHELGALVRHELAVDPDAFVAAATAARFGPPAGAAPAAPTRAPRAAGAAARHARAPAGARPRARAALASLVRLRAVRHAVVMAAGEGSRLRPLTERWPKPVLPIDGRPVIATLLRELAARGLRARGRRHRPSRRAGRGARRRRLGVRARGALRAPAGRARLGRRGPARRRRGRRAAVPRHARPTPSTRRATSAASPTALSASSARRGDRGAPRAAAGPPAGARQATGSSRSCSTTTPSNPLSAAPLWAFGAGLVPLLEGLSGPPYELADAVQRAIDAGLAIAGVEIGPTRDLTDPVDLVVENFPYLGR